MPPRNAAVTLVVGPEALLVERAIAAVVRQARAADADADVTEVDGGQLTAPALNEHVSPSLFTSRRVVVVNGVQDVADATAEALVAFCKAPIEDVSLVLVHPGGVKGKRLLDTLRKAGVQEIACDRLTRADDHVEFVRSEVAAHGGRIEQAAARALVEAIGGDLRGLASAAAQLAADADGGVIGSAAVATYFEGHAEVKGWVVADRAVEGRTADALEQLRWALETGTDPVLVTAALAMALRSLARLSGAARGVRDADLARDLGVPPWKVKILRGQLRGWTPSGLVRAIRAIADADLQVKGAGNDPTLALTTAIVEVGAARVA
ncbi:MAG TPA: DNA polymerase III subunit delta [Jiangellaceae bacterium]